MANLAGIDRPAGLDVVRGRPRGELAAALSRHGPDRLPAGAALPPALDRLSDAARLRAPADAVAQPDLAQPRHHRLQPELRLRPRDAPRRRRRCRPISISPAGASPASAATWCGRRAGALRRDVRARRASIARPSSRATAWPRSASPSPSARAARACAPTPSIATRWPRSSAPCRRAIADARRAPRFVLCGKVLPGHQLEVRGEDGTVLAGPRGRPHLRHRARASCRAISASPRPAREVLSADGWLDTGDLGYLLDGEIVVTGRAKDLIIVNGRNVWPQDIEWAIEAQQVVKSGDSAAFSVDTGEGERVVVAVLARVSGDEADGRRWRATSPAPCARRSRSIAMSCWCRRRMGLPHDLVGQAQSGRAPRPTISPAATPPSPPRPEPWPSWSAVTGATGFVGPHLDRRPGAARLEVCVCWCGAGRLCRRCAGVDAEIVWATCRTRRPWRGWSPAPTPWSTPPA